MWDPDDEGWPSEYNEWHEEHGVNDLWGGGDRDDGDDIEDPGVDDDDYWDHNDRMAEDAEERWD